MLRTMVSSAGEINPASHQQDVIFSPVPHSNASTPPNLMFSEYHPVYGHIPPDCTYYGPEYQYCAESYPHPQMCAVSTEYGPITVPLLSNASNPPLPLPIQVPPGHVVQQIVDENGTLRHVIVSHTPPLMPIPTFGPGNNAPNFYPPGPGYPSGQFTPMPAGGAVPSGVPSSHPNIPAAAQNSGLGPNSYVGPLPTHAPRDDRVARPFANKPKRKFDIKQQSRDVGTYNSSYGQNGPMRKDNNYVNTNRRNMTNGTSKPTTNGGVEEDGSTGSTGTGSVTSAQDEEEETRVLAQTEMLSTLTPPKVSDVASRSAFVQWNHPIRFTENGENKFQEAGDISDADFRYEVFISDRSRDNRFKSIFIGSALSCRVKDLKPGTNYAIQYCAMIGEVKGQASAPTNFNTQPAEPEPPISPKAVSRSRSSIHLKWNPPVNDNGSKITNYVVEFDEGKGGSHYVECYRGKNKQCTVSKLQPAYSYQFRVSALNQCGQSRFSHITAATSSSPPTQPLPPTLTEAGVTYLRLGWVNRTSDDEFTLQMEDPATGHGFLAIYGGNAPQYLCIGLKGNTKYKFRLKAQNEEGHSKWSDEVVFSTLPDRPGPPHKPTLKGRVHAYGFKIKWDPPSDTGGLPITDYALQIDKGSGYERIRTTETEYNVDRLSPGQSYALRVIAIGPGGESDPSDACVITTEPVCPGKCHIPRIVGKPKSNSVHLKWSQPDWDGGSPINQYEVGCTTPDNETQEALGYRGKETDCYVNRLLPGRAYLFQVRAYNRIGAGPWSDFLHVISGAGAPDAPAVPKVATKTGSTAVVSWLEPLNNGSAVTEYRVQLATPSITISVVGEQGDVKSVEPEAQSISTFNLVYTGPSTSCEVKGLQPASVHLFRVQAINSAGVSEWSPVATHQMPPSSPNAVGSVETDSTTDSIGLVWKAPAANGSPITHYNVIIGESIHSVTTESFMMDNLMPDTQFKIRIQAVNNVGPGALSSTVKIATKSLPPSAPMLSLGEVRAIWMKLKWTDAAPAKNVEYLVQMINPYKDEFEVVYRGTSTSTKVTRLIDDTEYQFRICAMNNAGQGPFSDLYKFRTSKAPPPQVKGVKAEFVKDSNVFRIEWFGVQCTDPLEYQLQVCKRRDQEYRTIFRGVERSTEVNPKDLDGTDMSCRVCAIRICDDDRTQLIGPYSVPFTFHVPASISDDFVSSKIHSSNSSKSLSTTAQVSSTFFQVLEEKMNEISYESRVGILAVFALILIAFLISLITHHVVS